MKLCFQIKCHMQVIFFLNKYKIAISICIKSKSSLNENADFIDRLFFCFAKNYLQKLIYMYM